MVSVKLIRGFLGSAMIIAYIIVSPQISDVSNITEVHLGMPAVLACLVTGYPLPSIVWRKDGEEFSDDTTSSRVDIIEVPAGNNFQSRGYNESVVDLLMMHTTFSVDQVLQLGELGVFGLLSIEETVRGDTANYTCTAANALPETTMLRTTSNISLVILSEFTKKYECNDMLLAKSTFLHRASRSTCQCHCF